MGLKEGQETRIKEVLSKCNNSYIDSTQFWPYYKESIRKYVAGQDILDIGCGRNGGLAKIVYELGAKSYTGIDIDHEFIEQSKKLTPNGEFICDDPIYVLDNIKTKPLIMSSGLFELDIVLLDRGYAKRLIKAIYNATAPGQVTIHTYAYPDDFHETFLSEGFESVYNPWHLNIYRKPKSA